MVTLPDRGAVIEIDAERRSIIDTVPVGSNPVGIAIWADAVWVANAEARPCPESARRGTTRSWATQPISAGPCVNASRAAPVGHTGRSRSARAPRYSWSALNPYQGAGLGCSAEAASCENASTSMPKATRRLRASL